MNTLAAILLAATIGSSNLDEHKIPEEKIISSTNSTTEEVTEEYNSFLGARNSNIEVGLVAAYNLGFLLPRWGEEDFLAYVKDPWPAGAGLFVNAEFKDYLFQFTTFGTEALDRNDGDLINFRGWYGRSERIYQELSPELSIENLFSGDFDPILYNILEEYANIPSTERLNLHFRGSLSTDGHWEIGGNGKTFSLGKEFLLAEEEDESKLEIMLKGTYFEYDVKATAEGVLRVRGNYAFKENNELVEQGTIREDKDYTARADIHGLGFTILLGPKVTFSPTSWLDVYGSLLAEFILVESQTYDFSLDGEQIVLPNELKFGRQHREISPGFDAGIKAYVLPKDLYIYLGVSGDAGVTHEAFLGIGR